MTLFLLCMLAPPVLAADESDMDAEVDRFIGESETPEQAKSTPTPNAFNPSITAFGDMLWSVGFDAGEVAPESTPWLRSLELDLRADVDPFAKAVATVAIEQEDPMSGHAHDDDGHEGPGFIVRPEEVFVDLVALSGGFSARVGQFLLPLGITNRMHPHDYPWPSAPMPFQEAIGSHGLGDVGAQLNYRVQHPLDGALSLHAAVISGHHFDPEGATASAGWVGRAELFQPLGSVELAIGGSATGLEDDWLGVADLLLRWRQSSTRSIVLLGEVFQQPTEPSSHDHEEEEGEHGDAHDGHEEEASSSTSWTSTVQFQPARSWYLGARYDQIGDENWIGGTISYYTSEFLRVRTAALAHEDTWRVDAQLTFVWGSHPVEPYWVNR